MYPRHKEKYFCSSEGKSIDFKASFKLSAIFSRGHILIFSTPHFTFKEKVSIVKCLGGIITTLRKKEETLCGRWIRGEIDSPRLPQRGKKWEWILSGLFQPEMNGKGDDLIYSVSRVHAMFCFDPRWYLTRFTNYKQRLRFGLFSQSSKMKSLPAKMDLNLSVGMPRETCVYFRYFALN